ncbi:MAG TPA: histidine kinase dimerization/phosphoacceptor domain -containing protein [Bacteroidia bacterium]|jgi:two-component sensor histidine kinase|nr:histidine kinase dimerization/phosphoacceptor domain -containing protein [Bacteroidia bacterium]
MEGSENNISLSQNKRANEILEVILSFARLEFSKKVDLSPEDDILDGIGAGVNMLGEELKYSDLTIKEKEQLLIEKEHLLKEIHHRVKNNLQIVSSLLNLQSENIIDEKFLELIKESQNRINSMALVHEMLYKSVDLSKVDLKEYIEVLTSSVNMSYSTPAKTISFNYDIEAGIFLEVDTMIPIGLMLNEILSNSFKYAFPGKDTGIISIKLKRDNNHINMIVFDNGVGLKKNFDIKKQGSLGMQLVHMLGEQIDAKIAVRSEKGTYYGINFTLK